MECHMVYHIFSCNLRFLSWSNPTEKSWNKHGMCLILVLTSPASRSRATVIPAVQLKNSRTSRRSMFRFAYRGLTMLEKTNSSHMIRRLNKIHYLFFRELDNLLFLSICSSSSSERMSLVGSSGFAMNILWIILRIKKNHITCKTWRILNSPGRR